MQSNTRTHRSPPHGTLDRLLETGVRYSDSVSSLRLSRVTSSDDVTLEPRDVTSLSCVARPITLILSKAVVNFSNESERRVVSILNSVSTLLSDFERGISGMKV